MQSQISPPKGALNSLGTLPSYKHSAPTGLIAVEISPNCKAVITSHLSLFEPAALRFSRHEETSSVGRSIRHRCGSGGRETSHSPKGRQLARQHRPHLSRGTFVVHDDRRRAHSLSGSRRPRRAAADSDSRFHFFEP